MNSLTDKLGVVSVVLMLPALFLSAAGFLYSTLGIEMASRLLEVLLAHAVFKAILSPVIVMGGPLTAFSLNAWKLVHLSADVVNEEFVIALSVKRLLRPLLCLILAGGLMLLLGAYAFVENFRIVAR